MIRRPSGVNLPNDYLTTINIVWVEENLMCGLFTVSTNVSAHFKSSTPNEYHSGPLHQLIDLDEVATMNRMRGRFPIEAIPGKDQIKCPWDDPYRQC